MSNYFDYILEESDEDLDIDDLIYAFKRIKERNNRSYFKYDTSEEFDNFMNDKHTAVAHFH